MSCEGTCKKWFADRGFGFITQHGVQSELGDIFVHFTGISQPGRKSLNIGEKVTFDLGSDAKSGKPRAENVSGDGSGKSSEELYPNKANRTGQPKKPVLLVVNKQTHTDPLHIHHINNKVTATTAKEDNFMDNNHNLVSSINNNSSRRSSRQVRVVTAFQITVAKTNKLLDITKLHQKLLSEKFRTTIGNQIF